MRPIRPPLSRMRATAIVAMLALALGACGITSVETPDPAQVPTGAPTPQGATPIGDVVEVGSGQVDIDANGVVDLGWRYVVFESADGLCTQLEFVRLTSGGCGEQLPEGEDAFGGVSVSELDGGIQTIDGIVTAETVTVWLVEQGGGRRSPATLMSLADAGIEANAFLGFVPEGIVVTHLLAVAFNGDVLETYELP